MDLVFLALHPQKGPDGVAAARGLKKADDNLNIVPVTADKMIDVEFVRLQPSGILILPFESHEVKAIADSCVKRRRELFIISSSRSRIAIPIDQICYINKKPHPDFRVVEIHCTNGRTYQSYMTTQEVEKQLAASGSFFLRIRNSCFVNPFFVHSVSSSHVRLIEVKAKGISIISAYSLACCIP